MLRLKKIITIAILDNDIEFDDVQEIIKSIGDKGDGTVPGITVFGISVDTLCIIVV